MPVRCNGRNKSFHVPSGDPSVLPLLLFTIVANDNHAIHLFAMKVFNPKAISTYILWNAASQALPAPTYNFTDLLIMMMVSVMLISSLLDACIIPALYAIILLLTVRNI